MVKEGTVTINTYSWSVYGSEDTDELAPYIGPGGVLQASEGALYIIPSPVYSIDVYLENFGFSVDFVFIGADNGVTGVTENIAPGSGILRFTGGPTSYVLIVHAGEAVGVNTGDNVSITLESGLVLGEIMPMMIIVMMMAMIMPMMSEAVGGPKKQPPAPKLLPEKGV